MNIDQKTILEIAKYIRESTDQTLRFELAELANQVEKEEFGENAEMSICVHENTNTITKNVKQLTIDTTKIFEDTGSSSVCRRFYKNEKDLNSKLLISTGEDYDTNQNQINGLTRWLNGNSQANNLAKTLVFLQIRERMMLDLIMKNQMIEEITARLKIAMDEVHEQDSQYNERLMEVNVDFHYDFNHTVNLSKEKNNCVRIICNTQLQHKEQDGKKFVVGKLSAEFLLEANENQEVIVKPIKAFREIMANKKLLWGIGRFKLLSQVNCKMASCIKETRDVVPVLQDLALNVEKTFQFVEQMVKEYRDNWIRSRFWKIPDDRQKVCDEIFRKIDELKSLTETPENKIVSLYSCLNKATMEIDQNDIKNNRDVNHSTLRQRLEQCKDRIKRSFPQFKINDTYTHSAVQD